jgi:hypothetical protein
MMKLRKVICTLVCAVLAAAGTASATTQIRDHLHTGVWTHEVLGGDIPREVLYGTNALAFHTICSACWRGYVAEWKIQDGRLYLLSARDFQGNSLSADADKLTAGGPVHATWLTGEFFSPKFRVLLLPSDLLGGVYVGCLVFDFSDGQLLSKRFTVEPIGAAILLIELMLLWLFVRWMMQRRRQKLAQQTSAGDVANRAAPEK